LDLTGLFGIFENPPQPSSPPTFLTSGPFFAASSSSVHSAALPTARAPTILQKLTDRTSPIIAPSSDPKSALTTPFTRSIARRRLTVLTHYLSRSTPSTRFKSPAKRQAQMTEIDEDLWDVFLMS
jgi:hypothetical protein